MGLSLRSPKALGGAAGPLEILVSTFNELFWYDVATGNARLVHTGAGRYYGVGVADRRLWFLDRRQPCLYAVSRPDQAKDDKLLVIDPATGRTLGRYQLASRDTHQMIRHRRRLLVVDSYRGRLLAYRTFPMSLARVYGDYGHAAHVNSVRIMADGIYLLCHNFGKSVLVRLDPKSGAGTDRYPDVGTQAHDIVPYGGAFIICDSLAGGLIRVDRATRACRTLWADEGHWTKGLVIHQGVAYFGLSRPAERQNRYAVECEIGAFDLAEGRLLWRRPVGRPGLVNSLATRGSLEGERRGIVPPALRLHVESRAGSADERKAERRLDRRAA